MFTKISDFFKFIYAKLFKINDTQQKVAIGFGLGVFAGILPGTGPLAALSLAFIFRANRAAALLGSLITNTWLSFVTFVLAIKAGSIIFNISWEKLQNDWAVATSHWHWQDLFSVSILEIIMPVMVGYLIISLCLGIISYVAVLIIIKKRKRCTP